MINKEDVSKQYEDEKRESQIKMFQKQVSQLLKFNLDNQANNDELKQ